MDEQEMTQAVMEAVEVASDEQDAGMTTRTFEEAGVMTMNKGFVVRTADGQEFQVTVVRSR